MTRLFPTSHRKKQLSNLHTSARRSLRTTESKVTKNNAHSCPFISARTRAGGHQGTAVQAGSAEDWGVHRVARFAALQEPGKSRESSASPKKVKTSVRATSDGLQPNSDGLHPSSDSVAWILLLPQKLVVCC